jgi:hypothetical protein
MPSALHLHERPKSIPERWRESTEVPRALYDVSSSKDQGEEHVLPCYDRRQSKKSIRRGAVIVNQRALAQRYGIGIRAAGRGDTEEI